MYGAAGDGVINMLERVLEALCGIGKQFGWDAVFNSIPLANFQLLPVRHTYAMNDVDLFRQIVLMHCSLSVLADEMETSANDTPVLEREANQQWATKIRDAIQVQRPDLGVYFNREAVLVDHGIPVKFGFFNPKLVAHFGMLRANTQPACMRDARAKMWELALAKTRNTQMKSALIFGTPGMDDITLSDKQRSLIIANTHELTNEAQCHNILFQEVQSTVQAVNRVIEMA